MLQPYKFELKIKYEGSSWEYRVRVLSVFCTDQYIALLWYNREESESRYIQVKAEKYIAIWGRSC